MTRCIWYISKYVLLPEAGDPVSRGYGLMREFARIGYQSVIITSDSMGKLNARPASNHYEISDHDNVTVCKLHTLKYVSAKSLKRMLSWLHFEIRLLLLPTQSLPRPDVIIVSSLSLLTVVNGLRLRRRFKCRMVFEVRDIWPLTLVTEGGFSSHNPLVMVLGAIEKLGYTRSDAIVGTMPNLASHVEQVTARRIPTYCVPMGLDTEHATSQTDVLDSSVASAIPRGKFIVGYAGSLGISNALDVLFQCAQLMSTTPRIHFVILGEGQMRHSYEARFGSMPNVTFAGTLPKNQVPAFLAACDLLYFSTHKSPVWDFGQSLNKVIDYMTAAKPIVASYSGYPSMINEAECGTFVPAGDAEALRNEICRISDMNPEDRTAMGSRGRKWLFSHRGYGILAAQYLAILKHPERPNEA